MESFYLYVLKSTVVDRKYIGISEDPLKRLRQHNSGHVRSTKAYAPWELVRQEEHPSKTDARKMELCLKGNSWKRKELFARIDQTLVAPSSNG